MKPKEDSFAYNTTFRPMNPVNIGESNVISFKVPSNHPCLMANVSENISNEVAHVICLNKLK